MDASVSQAQSEITTKMIKLNTAYYLGTQTETQTLARNPYRNLSMYLALYYIRGRVCVGLELRRRIYIMNWLTH